MQRMHIRWDETPRSVTWIAALSVAFVNAGAAWGSQPRLVTLTAATRLGETPPEGWTHLVMKSVPRLTSGDRDTLPTGAEKTATLFRTAILADVQGLGLDQQFILSRVGIGICVTSRENPKEDIVVTSDRLQSLSIKLSTVDEIVLDAMETELAEARIISRTFNLCPAAHARHHDGSGQAQQDRPFLCLLCRAGDWSPASCGLVDVAADRQTTAAAARNALAGLPDDF